MQFNFTFTFPEVSELNTIVISCDETYIREQGLVFIGPTFPKPADKPNFMGWEIDKVEGDMLLKASEPLLTKYNMFIFDASFIPSDQTVYNTTIFCKMKWKPTVTLSLIWDSFGPVNSSILGEAELGNLILGN